MDLSWRACVVGGSWPTVRPPRAGHLQAPVTTGSMDGGGGRLTLSGTAELWLCGRAAARCLVDGGRASAGAGCSSECERGVARRGKALLF
ncbi:hypothetical protein GQ55_5G297100 [Panicum hallii var. hallii]|uniref:Uncharacterized protein n=1 Tax=Panicum hallii var. hallii TaxID=1504633 RepID=A0A2T7DLE8_9POAL|nr:hypothetical protein GQ55_5G297100 [Panicum hallii var. hallii]